MGAEGVYYAGLLSHRPILALALSWYCHLLTPYCFLHLRPVFYCGGDLVGDSGFVGSEGFPNFYKPNSKCSWRITVSHLPCHISKHWLLHYSVIQCLTHAKSLWFPGSRGKRGYALFPYFWPGGWLTMSIRLSGCLQWPFQLSAKTGSFLWNFPAWRSYFYHKHHDARDGDWRRDTG